MTKWRLGIIGLVFIGLLGLGIAYWSTKLNAPLSSTYTTSDPSIRIGGDFTAIDQDGRAVDQTILNGKWTAIFFGFTYCPDVCPLTLQTLEKTQNLMGDKARSLQIVFVSIDPERDTPKALKAYLNSGGFPKGVIGLTGSPLEIKAITKAYRVVYEKVGTGDTYTMNHTSVIYLMNPKGEFAIPLAHGISPSDSARMIKAAMGEK
jgi:protein SCO1